jgi:hypothetical protein
MERYEQYPAEKLPPELNLMADHFSFLIVCLAGTGSVMVGRFLLLNMFIAC